MPVEIVILAFTCLTNLSLGLFILVRNPKLLSSLSFFALTASVSCWGISNYLTESIDIPLGANIIFNKLAYLFAFWCLLSIVVFCYSFPIKVHVPRVQRMTFSIFAVTFSVLTMSDLVTGHVTRQANANEFSVGPLSTVYALALFSLFVIGARRLLITRKHSNKSVKSQIRLMLIGFSASLFLGLLTNVIFPSIVESFHTAKYGPLLTVIVVATTTYAIVKHQLFDVRMVVARSVAYILLVATLGAIYFGMIFGVAAYILPDDDPFLWLVAPFICALIITATSSSLKRLFDRLTDQLFYRDAYDVQTFLDELNKVLVSSYRPEALLKKSAKIIEEYVKPTYVAFVVRGGSDDGERYIGTGNAPKIAGRDIDTLQKILAPNDKHLIAAGQLDRYKDQLHSTFGNQDIDVIGRLTASTKDETAGYLFLGPKKSGNIYSEQDLRVLEIITNQLIIAIQNALRYEEIESFNATLQKKVADATRQLRHSNEKLKELDETKDDFISMASHQLRTPLTSVKGYISMVLEGDAGKVTPMQKEMLSQAYVSSQRMVYLIADLLNVSRLKTGKFVIERVGVNLAEVIQQELDQLKDTAASRGLTLKYDKPKDFPTLLLDETKTRQVVMNFADNAIYYTPSGGEITISLEEKASTIEMRIQDNGIGVPKNEQPHLFTKFYRAGNARKARPDGTGLGLFMAKKVVVTQGGSLLFESKEGKGSMFGFVFPKSLTATPTDTKQSE